MTRDQSPPLEDSDSVRLRFGSFELDEANARLLQDGRPLALAPRPFAVLCSLLRQPGLLVTKNALLDAVWGHRFVSDSVLKTAINELRRVLGDDARQPRYIETVSRRGYRFIAPTVAIPRPSGAVDEGSGTRAPSAQPLVGREQAFTRLRLAWQRALNGERAVVWIAGEPGVGKTALVDSFLSSLDSATAMTARGTCFRQHGAGEPYLPVLEAIGELARNDPAVPGLLRSIAPSWLMQLPWMMSPEEHDSLRYEWAGALQSRMLREMGEFLDRYTERRPLLLITDNLHWSDSATIELIDHVARRRGRSRLMWLASFRLAEVIAFDHPLKAVRNELRVHGLCEEIVLDPFSQDEVAQYVAMRAPDMAHEAFLRELHKRTEGLPLFVSHVMTELIAQSASSDRGTIATSFSPVVPESIAGFIDHYVERLSDEQRIVLEAAAAYGLRFDVHSVATVVERDPSAVADVCDELTHQQLWLREAPAEGDEGMSPSYCFRHSLFREVLYRRLGALARARIHAAIAARIEHDRAAGRPTSMLNLAAHYERGGNPAAALGLYVDVAEPLLHVSPAEVLGLTEHALALVPRVPESLERNSQELTLWTLSGIAESYVHGIATDQAKQAFSRAYALLDAAPGHPLRATLLLQYGYLLCLRSEHAEALALADRTEDLWGTTQDPAYLVGTCTIRGEVDLLRGRPRSARDWLERGIAALEADASPATTFIADPLVTLLGMLAIQLFHLGLVEQARTRMQEARARARELRQGLALAVVHWDEALLEVRLGNTDGVSAVAEEMQVIDKEFAFRQSNVGQKWMRGWVLAHGTQPHEGHRLIREAYDEDRQLGMTAGSSEMLGYCAEALVLAGDLTAAQHELDEALLIVSTLGERVYLPQLFLIEAAIADTAGNSGAARASILRALAEAREQEAPWLEMMTLIELCRRPDASDADRLALARLLDTLPEATGTTAWMLARSLLDSGAESPPERPTKRRKRPG